MNDMRSHIELRLQSLNLELFEFEDQSHLHAGHAGNRGGGHFAVLLVSNSFDGVTRINRQRMVQELLADLFAAGAIHALSITAKTPAEYFH